MSAIKDFSSIINDIAHLGQVIREQRKVQGLSQAEFAGLCGVGNRFLSDLENGKPTIRFDKALKVIHSLGLDLSLRLRNW